MWNSHQPLSSGYHTTHSSTVCIGCAQLQAPAPHATGPLCCQPLMTLMRGLASWNDLGSLAWRHCQLAALTECGHDHAYSIMTILARTSLLGLGVHYCSDRQCVPVPGMGRASCINLQLPVARDTTRDTTRRMHDDGTSMAYVSMALKLSAASFAFAMPLSLALPANGRLCATCHKYSCIPVAVQHTGSMDVPPPVPPPPPPHVPPAEVAATRTAHAQGAAVETASTP